MFRRSLPISLSCSQTEVNYGVYVKRLRCGTVTARGTGPTPVYPRLIKYGEECKRVLFLGSFLRL